MVHRSPSGPPRRIHAKRFPRSLARSPVNPLAGTFGLVAAAYGRLDRTQLEAARKAIRRRLRRQGDLRLVVFPTLPRTQKPLQSRMGRGKGRLAGHFCWVRPGQSLLVLSGVPPARARQALAGGSPKLPLATILLPVRSLQA
jgi:large subunit ribosomal protein L16